MAAPSQSLSLSQASDDMWLVNGDWVENPTQEEVRYNMVDLRRKDRIVRYNGLAFDLDVKGHRLELAREKGRVRQVIYSILLSLSQQRIDAGTLTEELTGITEASLRELKQLSNKKC